MNPNAVHWRGTDPWRGTGASGWRDLGDLRQWCEGTGFQITGRVLDIGCGTGRMAAACDDYIGVDITPHYVEYAQAQGIDARLTITPDDMPAGPFDRILMCSVMTHMSHADRLAYLPEIRSRLAGEALIDILPGVHDAGNHGAWYCDPDVFRADLQASGFKLVSEFTWAASDHYVHKYHRVR